ncbi:MAG: ATP-grasp domain-containing protein [Candidatus Thiodiazotropha sp.]
MPQSILEKQWKQGWLLLVNVQKSQPDQDMNILVTDGSSRAALAITRSLGKAGHRIFVASHSAKSLAGYSKYCFKCLIYPKPELSVRRFVESIAYFVEEEEIEVLLPVSDITTITIAEHRNLFEPGCKLPFPDSAILKQAADKANLIEIAKRLEVPIPSSVRINGKEEIDRYIQEVNYPVVVKPSKSRIQTDDRWLSTSVDYAHSASELKSKLLTIPETTFPVLLQSRIEGPGTGLFYCFQHGQPIAVFCHKRLREKPPSGGVSVLRESVEPNPFAKEYGERLLKEIHWHGVAMVEFKQNEADQTPYLMEINGRFWGSLQLAIDSGVDFPKLLIETLSNNSVKPVNNYKIGVQTRWLCGDLDLLLMRFFKSSKSLNLPHNYPSRFSSFIEFMKFCGKNLYYEVLRLDDIRPWLFEITMWLLRKG